MSGMMGTSGLSSGDQSSSSIGDLMTPLLMIILLERLVEGQMEQGDVVNQYQGKV